MNSYNFTLLDTSSPFLYLPAQDGPIDTSWNASFSESDDSTWLPQTIGAGVSQNGLQFHASFEPIIHQVSSHRTSLKGASVHLDWIGTAIYLYGRAAPGGYTIRLDGNETTATPDATGLLFSQDELDYGPHSVALEVVEGEISITSAIITAGVGETGSVSPTICILMRVTQLYTALRSQITLS